MLIIILSSHEIVPSNKFVIKLKIAILSPNKNILKYILAEFHERINARENREE